jgi:hypothetical protein
VEPVSRRVHAISFLFPSINPNFYRYIIADVVKKFIFRYLGSPLTNGSWNILLKSLLTSLFQREEYIPSLAKRGEGRFFEIMAIQL